MSGITEFPESCPKTTSQTSSEVSGPAVLLIGPQMGENIGACARAMANFALKDLRLVAPRDGWPNPRAWAMASGAFSILEECQVFDRLEEAVADLPLLFATTARQREIPKPVHTPEAVALEIVQKESQGLRAGILFGCERWGLTNAEIALCDGIITFPVAPSFSSLNLAQAVVLWGSAWFKAQFTLGNNQSLPPSPSCPVPIGEEEAPAPKQELAALCTHLESALEKTGYFRTEERKPAQILALRALFTKARFSSQELRTLRGVIAALEDRAHRASRRISTQAKQTQSSPEGGEVQQTVEQNT